MVKNASATVANIPLSLQRLVSRNKFGNKAENIEFTCKQAVLGLLSGKKGLFAPILAVFWAIFPKNTVSLPVSRLFLRYYHGLFSIKKYICFGGCFARKMFHVKQNRALYRHLAGKQCTLPANIGQRNPL